MTITNLEVINRLNNIGKFADAENTANKALLSAKGEYAINRNKKALLGAYKTYLETYEKIKSDADEVKKLLELEVEIEDMRYIGEEDFKDGITSLGIMALEFMTV